MYQNILENKLTLIKISLFTFILVFLTLFSVSVYGYGETYESVIVEVTDLETNSHTLHWSYENERYEEDEPDGDLGHILEYDSEIDEYDLYYQSKDWQDMGTNSEMFGEYMTNPPVEVLPGDEFEYNPISMEQPNLTSSDAGELKVSFWYEYLTENPETAVLDVSLYEVDNDESDNLGTRISSKTFEDVPNEDNFEVFFDESDGVVQMQPYIAEATLIVTDAETIPKRKSNIGLLDEWSNFFYRMTSAGKDFFNWLFVPDEYDFELVKQNLEDSIFGPVLEVREYFKDPDFLGNDPYDIDDVGIPLDPDQDYTLEFFPDNFKSDNPLFSRDMQGFNQSPMSLLRDLFAGMLWLVFGLYIIKRFKQMYI